MLLPPTIFVINDTTDINSVLGKLKEKYNVIHGKLDELSKYPDCTLVLTSDVESVPIIKTIRNINAYLPIVVYSTNTNEACELENITAGATDFITNFNNIEILHAKLQRDITRYDDNLPRVLSKLVWYPNTSKIVFDDGTKIIIPTKGRQLLMYLIKCGPQGASVNELLTCIGINVECETHTIQMHIARLRAKLNDYSKSAPLIEYRKIGGYRIPHLVK